MPQEQILQIGHPNEVMDTGVRYIGAAQINCLAAMKGANGPQVRCHSPEGSGDKRTERWLA
ncbi:hypothetical protein [Rubripirellula obstinata]|uniref:hypothetical protein n=1 Tax=Rubripirellula obstinata TaxID=406547 RepID=UPI00122C781F|nr:hypothetical protein [Rubripirellula obstinata]